MASRVDAIFIFRVGILPNPRQNPRPVSNDSNNHPVDRWLDAAAEFLKHRKTPGSLWAKLLRIARLLLKTANVLHFLLLLALLLLMKTIGERHWLTAFCLFVPGQLWLLPLAVLAPLTLLLCRRWLLVHLAGVLLVAFGYYSFYWAWPPAPARPVLTVMSNNFGQNNRQGFSAFLAQENPDLVVLQEAAGQGGRLARGYTNYQVKAWGEFVLLSKLPILNSGPVPAYSTEGVPVAAWFEVSFQSRTVVVYNVHLPSPRRELYRSRGLGLLAALAGSGQDDTRTGRYRQGLEDSWKKRTEIATKLADHLKKETRPFVVTGDFNMSSHGYIYDRFAENLADAHATSGRGYGLTFPGYTSNPVTLFGPWLRLDYLFAGKGFRPVDCRTEAGRKSQHRAVAARFEAGE